MFQSNSLSNIILANSGVVRRSVLLPRHSAFFALLSLPSFLIPPPSLDSIIISHDNINKQKKLKVHTGERTPLKPEECIVAA